MTETTIPITVQSISDGFHLVVSVKVEGKTARMILDTAASRTIFDKKRILKLIKEPVITNNTVKASTAAGEIEQQHTQINKLELGDLKLDNYTATLLDLKELNNAYKQHKLQPIDGIIGADILVIHRGIIDLEYRELTFEV